MGTKGRKRIGTENENKDGQHHEMICVFILVCFLCRLLMCSNVIVCPFQCPIHRCLLSFPLAAIMVRRKSLALMNEKRGTIAPFKRIEGEGGKVAAASAVGCHPRLRSLFPPTVKVMFEIILTTYWNKPVNEICKALNFDIYFLSDPGLLVRSMCLVCL